MIESKKEFPITNATFNLTQGCNLACEYCFTYGKRSKKMSFDVGKKCVDFLLRNARDANISDLNGGKRQIDISFWGGEPFLEWELLKSLVLYANRERGDIRAIFGGTTNGVLLTEDKLPFLEENRVLFMVSLDGTQETHDKYRRMINGKGSHSIIMKNMEHVMKKWPFYKVRMSPYAEGIHRFCEDVKYLVDHGMYSIMFSPVYESGWTEDYWKTWELECYKVVDLISEYRKKGIKVEIEHFKSYMTVDRSAWPCGAGRFYVGFDIDGSIYPCHRFNKFNDERYWKDKEVCIGHVDYGITNPKFRDTFINYHPFACGDCEFSNSTPCHGGCYAVNFDLTGDIRKAPESLCRYVKMQKAVSEYYKEKIGMTEVKNFQTGRSCICYNMCYAENTPQEIKDIDDSGMQCHCNFANYTGPLDPKVAKSFEGKTASPNEVMDLLKKIDKRLIKVERHMNKGTKNKDE